MNRRLARGLALAVAAFVLAFSGLYVLIYLARWEWNRAIMSGFIFLAMLTVVSTVTILRRLRELSELWSSQHAEPDETVHAALGSAGRDVASRRFEWLRPDRPSVFVPILLGTGIVLSALAYLIERIAGLVASATTDRRTAALLPLHLPLATPTAPARLPDPSVGLRAPGSTVLGRSDSAERRRARRRSLALLVVIVLAVGAGTETIRRLTQSGTGDIVSPGATTMTIEIRTTGERTPETLMSALWTVCAGRLSSEVRITSMRSDGPTVTITIDHALGETGRRRLVGCLEDLTIERVLAEVTHVHSETTN
ncbi:MAG: hypothetical protein Q8M22_13855 [Actinomycetota bacterium]|nr:hypothetical protein [Actinomycetota bacterium]